LCALKFVTWLKLAGNMDNSMQVAYPSSFDAA